MRLATAVSALLLTSLLAACSSQPPAPEKLPSGSDGSASSSSATTGAVGDGIDPNSLAALKDPNSPLSKRNIYFDFDSFIVKDEYKPLLEKHGKFLGANGTMKMLVQGNADDRGSREYNLALGQKRAEAVKKMVLINGGTEAQVEAVSLGEEKPKCTEQGESCWAQNRRGDMLYKGEF